MLHIHRITANAPLSTLASRVKRALYNAVISMRCNKYAVYPLQCYTHSRGYVLVVVGGGVGLGVTSETDSKQNEFSAKSKCIYCLQHDEISI